MFTRRLNRPNWSLVQTRSWQRDSAKHENSNTSKRAHCHLSLLSVLVSLAFLRTRSSTRRYRCCCCCCCWYYYCCYYYNYYTVSKKISQNVIVISSTTRGPLWYKLVHSILNKFSHLTRIVSLYYLAEIKGYFCGNSNDEK